MKYCIEFPYFIFYHSRIKQLSSVRKSPISTPLSSNKHYFVINDN